MTPHTLEQIDQLRIDATRGLETSRRAHLGQFLTPNAVAQQVVTLFDPISGNIRLLDAGAGVGSLTAAFVRAASLQKSPPNSISVRAVEVDHHMIPYLQETLGLCRTTCEAAGIDFTSEVVEADFILHAVRGLSGEMFSEHCLFTHAVLNPPYKKIQSTSRARLLLRSLGIETSNLYTAFLELTARSLEDKGQLVAITPRSFCNGIYFREFRRQFTAAMRFDKVHLFNSRSAAFQEDNVLQENVIFHATRGGTTNSVTITTGDGPSDGEATVRRVPFNQFIYPGDPEMFIHLTANDHGTEIAQRILSLKSTLADINIAVSTGRVVEFRSRERLRETATDDTVPLIYPRHFSNGGIRWPHPTSAKPNAITNTPETRDQFVCGGPYVLVKRFTSKEERRRVVAVVYNVESTNSQMVAFENHINFFHRDGCQLPKYIALGLAAYLNSTLVDTYFRQFSGSTQVNATDLRNLPYPTVAQLEKLGRLIEKTPPVQEELDVHLEHLIFANP